MRQQNIFNSRVAVEGKNPKCDHIFKLNILCWRYQAAQSQSWTQMHNYYTYPYTTCIVVKRLAGKSFSEMTHFLSSGVQNPNSVKQPLSNVIKTISELQTA